MKAADRLSQRFAANITESMGATSAAAPVHGGPPAGYGEAVHGGPGEKYRGAARVKDALSIELDRITADPDQPRKEFEPAALADLAASLKARGQLQPIRVRWDEGAARWVVIAGERRFRAAMLAGMETLLCVEAKGTMDADEILEDQMVENCVREDLRPIEQARAFKTLMERRGLSYRQLADRLNISHQAIVRAVALLELPEDIQSRVESGQLAPSVAYEVARIGDPEAQRDVAERIASEGLTRADVAGEVRRAAGVQGGKGRGGRGRKLTSRVFRSPTARVTVELRKGDGPEAIFAALEAAVAQAREALALGGQVAA